VEFYKLSVLNTKGEELKMSNFQGKAVLIVNTATKCGLVPQFNELEMLHQRYKDKGLVVLGFPCDQFLNQEPETNESLVEACRINFGVTFQLTQKINVNGDAVHPIFKFLKDELRGTIGKKIKWNFTKFLITPNGKPFKRYAPTTKPKRIEQDIIQLLNL